LRTLSSGNPSSIFPTVTKSTATLPARAWARVSSSTRSTSGSSSWARIGLGRKALAPFRRQASARSFSLEMMITGMWRRAASS